MDQSPVPDEHLVQRIARGDPAALEELYDRYVRQCFGLALRIVGDHGLAEEIVQEVFLKIWTKPSSYSRDRGKFVSWLLSLIHHRSIDELRRRSRTEVPLESPETGGVLAIEPDPQPGPGEQVWIREQQRAVRGALIQLPDNQRQVLELAYFGGLSQSQIAEKLSQPLGTVKTRMRMGMQTLKTMLAPLGLRAD